MTQTWLPWNDYPGLTRERLLIVGDIIRDARGEAADDHRPDKYETNWSLGVRGYERTCGAISWSVQEHPWLSVVSGAGGGPVHFVMTIGGHPVRFYRGEPDEIPARYQQPSLPEVVELQRALAIDSNLPEGRCLRIAIDNDATGRPSAIYLVEIDEELATPTNVYLIPELEQSGTVAEFARPIPPAEIPPVTAEAIEDAGQVTTDHKKTGSRDE